MIVLALNTGLRLASEGSYKSIRTVFDKACAKAGLSHVTQHDLRHTWCSRLGEKGVDDRTFQELGGWKTLKMVQRYSHTNDHTASGGTLTM